MKKIIILFIFLLLLTGCNKLVKEDNQKEINNDQNNNQINSDLEENIYQDRNPIKIALYEGTNGSYLRVDTFYSKMEALKDIGLFSIILSQDEKVTGNNIKGLYKDYSSQYENFSNYKIGYHIAFSTTDGTTFSETILKPLTFSKFPFSDYLYVWFYDDINNSGFYSHIEEDEYNENTVMSSIKLMSAKKSGEINSPIELTVFTYDEDDFSESGNYIGVSKYKISIVKEDVWQKY